MRWPARLKTSKAGDSIISIVRTENWPEIRFLAARMSVFAHTTPRYRDFAQAMLRDCTHRNVAGDGTAVDWLFQAKGGKWPNFSLNLCADQPPLYLRVSCIRLSSA